MLRRNLIVLLSAAIGIAVLCGLGTWQLQRLAWKQDLIAKLEARLKAEPMPLVEALRRHYLGEDVEYLRVKAVGHHIGPLLYKQTAFNGLPGWEAIAGVTIDDANGVLVDLGAGNARPENFSLGKVDIEGVLRLHNLGKGFFDPDNDKETNHWYWWDIAAMQDAAVVEGPIRPVVQMTVPVVADFTPAEPKVELRNNHLGYAITWFGLAVALAAVTGVFVFQRRGS